MTSYLFNGQWTTDKYNRKYRHMYIIPFPVCAYAAIHYEGRRLMNELLRRKTTRKYKKNKIKKSAVSTGKWKSPIV